MKKNRFLQGLLVLSLGLVISCSFDSGSGDKTRRFVITDSASGNVLSSYDYNAQSGRLVQSAAYGPDNAAKRVTQYVYDTAGNLSQSIVQTPVNGKLVSSVINYRTEVEYDAANRLTKARQISDTGDTVEVFYGYDETGTLRGVVEKKSDDSLLMMDY